MGTEVPERATWLRGKFVGDNVTFPEVISNGENNSTTELVKTTLTNFDTSIAVPGDEVLVDLKEEFGVSSFDSEEDGTESEIPILSMHKPDGVGIINSCYLSATNAKTKVDKIANPKAIATT